MLGAVQTIAAVSTAPGTAGLAVIRISGPRAGPALDALAGGRPPPRHARHAVLKDPRSGEPLDAGLVLWFPAPRSFSGEDVAELQVHGGRAVVKAVLAAVLSVEGVRPAEAGEFTRRAFENGRLDLSAVEGLADLIRAETEAQRRQAYAHYAGRLKAAAEALRDRLLACLALVEATIDFPDEDEVTGEALTEARRIAVGLRAEVLAALAQAGRGERVRDGLVVAIAGPPNAGKSTLLNRLARREVAIVSPHAGTTRDPLEVHLDLEGCEVVLVDTAGLRDSGDPVEMEGIRRARERVRRADLVLWLAAPDTGRVPEPQAEGAVWRIATKADTGGDDRLACRHRVSAVTGSGVEELMDDLAAFARERIRGEPAMVVNARHRALFESVRGSLDAALASERWDREPELVAENLRCGLEALGRITGRVGPEAVLDVIFSSFCLGK